MVRRNEHFRDLLQLIFLRICKLEEYNKHIKFSNKFTRAFFETRNSVAFVWLEDIIPVFWEK
jgi:hypothetical protein